MSDEQEPIDLVDGAEPPFRYHREADGRIVVTGDVDMASADAFRPVLLASTDPIVLDLSAVSFMDSSGVKVLLQAARVRPVHILSPSRPVARVLELLGLTAVFES